MVSVFVSRRIFLGAKMDLILNGHRRTCIQTGNSTVCEDTTNNDLRYATRTSGGTWSIEPVETRGTIGIYTGIAVDAAGSLYVVGGTVGDSADVLVLKFDAMGDLLWRRTWDGPAAAPFSSDTGSKSCSIRSATRSC